MRAGWASTPALFAAVLASCDNPVTDTAHDEPSAVVIIQGATEIARADANGFTDDIIVAPGRESEILTVIFLDDDGDELDPEGDHVLGVTSGDPDVATWIPATPGAFSGRVRGAEAGQTMFTFHWIHGTVLSGHSEGDFDVRVTVSP